MSLLLLPKKKSMIVHQNRLSQKQKLKLDRLLVLCCILFRSSVLLLADATSTAVRSNL
jgi:hypothetical protein